LGLGYTPALTIKEERARENFQSNACATSGLASAAIGPQTRGQFSQSMTGQLYTIPTFIVKAEKAYYGTTRRIRVLANISMSDRFAFPIGAFPIFICHCTNQLDCGNDGRKMRNGK
jgi:hypothetical protein